MVNLLQELITALEDLRLAVYIETASRAIYLYDYLLTFEDERTYMWPKEWSPTKVVFFMIRYLPSLDLVVTAFYRYKGNLSVETCLVLNKTVSWLDNFGVVTAEFILVVRTYAIWGRSQVILVLLTVWSIANLIPDVFIMSSFLRSIRFTAMPPGLSGCLVTSGNDLLIGVWILLMVYEMALVILLAVQGVKMFKEMDGIRLAHVFFRDGAMFYVCIFTLSMANVIALVSHDKAKYGMFAGLERVTHSVLMVRLLLSLPKATKRPEQDNIVSLEAMEFGERPGSVHSTDSEAEVGIPMSEIGSIPE